MYLGFRLTGGAEVIFGNFLIEALSCGSIEVAECNVIVDDDELAPSTDAAPSFSAEFRRIIIVLVFGNFKLCSRRPSSL